MVPGFPGRPQGGNGEPKESLSPGLAIRFVGARNGWGRKQHPTRVRKTASRRQRSIMDSDQEIPADWQTVSRSQQHALPCLEKKYHDMQQQQPMPITPDCNIVVVGQQPIRQGIHHRRVCESQGGSILFPNGDRGAESGAPETIRGPAAQSPPARIVTTPDLHTRARTPGLGARQGAGGMLSSLPIGRGRVGGPTSLYTRTPLPRVRQDGRPLVISTSRSPSLASPVFPVFPSTRWITLKPTLPNWSQLPRPSSAHAPKPPDLERRRKHLRTMKDPVIRTDSPYTDPSVKGPRSQLRSHQNPPQTVNSTSPASALDPGRVAVANRRLRPVQ